MTFQRDLAWQQLELRYRSSVSSHCARYALTLDYSKIPDHVLHQAKRCVIDALGCAIGAYEAPGRTICEDTVREIGGIEQATVFCSGMRTSAMNAALVNSFLVRFLDYNDLGGGAHNSDALSSIIAVCEREKADGKALLTSLVISYELGARFRESLSPPTDVLNSLGPKSQLLPSVSPREGKPIPTLEQRGWCSDIRGGLSMPPALGKLMGLNEEQIANAIGVCLSHTLPLGILDANLDENVMAKNLRFGWVAHDAILACMLAKKGFTGPMMIMESESGIRKVIADGHMDFDRLTDFSGWRILGVKFKSMPSNSTTQGPIMAALSIVNEHDLKPEDIASVHIRASVRESLHTTTASKKYPRSAENADHSVFYGTAFAIKERVFDLSSINPEKFTDPVILDLIEKTTVEGDPGLTHFQGAAEITTKDGRKFYKLIDAPRGLVTPLTDEELETKFREMASKYMSQERIDEIFDLCWNLEKEKDISRLTRLMVF